MNVRWFVIFSKKIVFFSFLFSSFCYKMISVWPIQHVIKMFDTVCAFFFISFSLLNNATHRFHCIFFFNLFRIVTSDAEMNFSFVGTSVFLFPFLLIVLAWRLRRKNPSSLRKHENKRICIVLLDCYFCLCGLLNWHTRTHTHHQRRKEWNFEILIDRFRTKRQNMIFMFKTMMAERTK